MKGSGDRVAAQSWACFTPASLSQPPGGPRDTRVVWGASAVKWPPEGAGVGWQGGRSGWGRGFVLRASDDVLIFISCY